MISVDKRIVVIDYAKNSRRLIVSFTTSYLVIDEHQDNIPQR